MELCFEISVGILNMTIRGPVAQSVASLTADPGVASLIPDRSHTFMEIDCEISSHNLYCHSLPIVDSRPVVVGYKRK